MSALLPLYHPTTCLVVDDDRLYLDSFDYNYADVTLCATEQRPEQAIQRLLKDAERTGLTIEEVNRAPVDDGEAGDPLVRLPASRIAAIARDPARFSRVSVVVVDFAMPSMTGFELLQKIKHLPVKKVLLTGKTGDSTAVAAFNEGLISLFLVKQDPDLLDKLRRIIRELQYGYFKDIAAPLEPIAKLEDTAFLDDPEIASWCDKLAERIGAVEHYLLPSPPGLMLVDESGQVTLAWINNQDRMRAQLEIAIDDDAPAALVKKLRAGDAILACPTPTGFYEEQHVSDWQRYLLPCEEIRGNTLWKVAVQRDQALCLSDVSLRQYRGSQAGRVRAP
ncbi:MAG: response regulator [Rhodomicrobium sp.]